MKNTHHEPQTQHTLSVYFCGQEDCGSGHSFGPAMRPHYLLHVIYHGKGIYQCGGHTYHLNFPTPSSLPPKPQPSKTTSSPA